MAKKSNATKTTSSQGISVAALPPPQEVAAELPYPIIQYAANNSVLYPLDAAEGTTATLSLPAGSTQVFLHFAIKGQSIPTFPPIPVTSGNVADIPWPWISRCTGHTVLISYEATAGGKHHKSLVLELEIQLPREEDLVGSRPVFKHSALEWSTWWLDMHKFVGDEIIEIKAWPMIQAGDQLFLVVAGDQHQTPYSFIWVAYGHVVTAAEAHADFVFRFSLSRAWMSRRQDYSALTPHLGVIRDTTQPINPTPGDPLLENPLPLNAQDFHLRTTTLLRADPTLSLKPPHLRESAECGADGWVVNPVNTVRGGHAEVNYDGMAAKDLVVASVSGPGFGPVSLGSVEVQDGEIAVVFDVEAWIIAALFNNEMTLFYAVSFNGYEPQVSPERVIKVLGPQLTKPGIEQATGDVVDLNTFNDHATGVVPIWDYAAVGQCCWMWVTGEDEDGNLFEFYVLDDEPLTPNWLANGVDTPIPRDVLQKMADCSDFELHFAVSFDRQCDLAKAIEFPLQTFNVVQKALVLPQPTVLEAVGSNLTVYNGKDGVTVRVKYPLISNNHQISIYWKRSDGTCLPVASKPGDGGVRHTDFDIPREAVIHGIGKTVTIHYTVTSACKLQTSEDLDLMISVPVRLPSPVIAQATPPATNGGILDLATFAGNAQVAVVPWWFILPGQRVWLRAMGTKATGGVHAINVYLGKIVSAAEVSAGLADMLKRADLDLLSDGSSLTVTCKVTPDGGPDESSAVVFPSLTVVIRKPLDDYTPFTGGNWNNWRAGAAANGEMKSDVVFGKPCVSNGTLSVAYAGAVLYKDFTGLQVGRTYQFSIEACTYNGAAPFPILSLSTNAGTVAPSTTFSSMSWQLLSASFVATTSTMRLNVNSWVTQGAASGMDYAITNIRVKG